MDPSPAFPFAFLGCVWLILVIGATIGWIFFLVAAWRGMRAHESIAHSLDVLARGLGYTLARSPGGAELGQQPERTQ